MFEIDNKIDRIKYYFKKVISTCELNVIATGSSNKVQLTNEKCTIDLSTGRYYCEFTIHITNIENGQKYYIGDLLNKMGLIAGTKLLSENEISDANQINDELEASLFAWGIILNKYFSDILNGDFSILG